LRTVVADIGPLIAFGSMRRIDLLAEFVGEIL
jgi:hypothetical protein